MYAIRSYYVSELVELSDSFVGVHQVGLMYSQGVSELRSVCQDLSDDVRRKLSLVDSVAEGRM